MRWNSKPLIVVALLAASSLPWAATTDQPIKPVAAASGAMPSKPASDPMKDMDAHMKTMAEMHQKMMNAKTAEERQALMADHMKAMRGGMDMMKGMGAGSKGHMQGMPGMKGMSEDHTSHHRMMEKRMEMMGSMMELMMDRLPQAPSK